MRITERVLSCLGLIRYRQVILKPDELLADRRELRATYWRRLVIRLTSPANVRKPVVLTRYVELRKDWHD